MKTIPFIGFLLISFVLYFLISLPIYSGDVKNHVAWGESLLIQGSYGFFDRTFPGYSFPTYPPLIMFSFAASWGLYQLALSSTYFLNSFLSIFPSGLVPWMEWENVWISFLKLPGLLGAIAFAGVLPWVLKKTGETQSIKNKYLIAFLLLINPAVIYVASVWGQTDLIQNLFLVLALGFTFSKKFWWAFIFAGIALMTKHTILLLWGVYMFYLLKEFGVKKMLQGIGVSLIIFYLSYLPFHSPSLIWPLQFYYSNFTLVDFGVAENALNMWGAIIDFGMAPSSSFAGISYDLWGYLLFTVFVLPITLLFYFKKTTKYQLFQYLFLISGFYFFFFTRMHERYMIPVVLFATILVCFKQKKILMINNWINFLFFTFLHFINVYRGLFQPTIPIIYDLTKSHQFLLFLVIGYGVLMMYNYTTFLQELQRSPKREKLIKW
jgi:Gpi18-like mannosyltransferase